MSIQQEKFKEIADKIREKTGTTDLIAPNDFAAKIDEVYDRGVWVGKYGEEAAPSTGKNATDEFVASEYSEAEGVGTEAMYFPEQGISSIALGINNLKNGNWARYDNLFFTGNETVFSFDYATENEHYLGNLDVYIDEISEANLIASGRDLDGGAYNWSTVKTHEAVLSQTIPAGSHSVIIVGLEPTLKEGQTEVEGDIRFGIRTFRFVNGPIE